MDTEKCPFCGASVKKENRKGHFERVHPKRAGPVGGPRETFAKSTSVFKSRRRRNAVLVAVLVLAVVGVAAASQQFAKSNTMQMHWHPELSVTINGSPVTVPANLGTPQGTWVDHSLDQYGIGMAPLHTHDDPLQDGYRLIHEESNTVRDFTLQEFLAIWGQRLDSSQVLNHPVNSGHRAYLIVDGAEKQGTLDAVFVNGQKVQIVCGP